MQLRQVQGQFVENSKRMKQIKEAEKRQKDQEDYQKAVVHNTYYNKRDEQVEQIKERQRRVDEFQKACTDRYLQQVDQQMKEKMMRETYL